MSWIETVPLIFAGVVFLVFPGGLAATGLGLRGLAWLAAAPPLTVAISAVLAVALPYAGIRWSSVAILLGGVVLGAALIGLRKLFRDPSLSGQWTSLPRFDRGTGWLGAAFGVGAVLILVQLALAFGAPTNISQTFDNVFHLNGVRYILDTGSASSLTMSSMASGGAAPYFYPAAWHGLVAGLIQLTGASLPAGVNVFNMVVAAVMWPLGCMFLTRVVVGKRPVAIASAAVLSALFSAFPILLLDFGVLYPNFLSVAMLPATLGSLAVFFGLGKDMPVPSWSRFVLPVLLIPGVALAHPNGFMSLLVLSIPVIMQSYSRNYLRPRRPPANPQRRVIATVGLAAFAVVFIVMWKYVRPPQDAAFWGPIHSPLRAVFEVATNSAMDRPVAPAISILMLLGLVLAARYSRNFWIVAGLGITAVLFLIVSGTPISSFRMRVTGVWYNDSYRLAALLPMTAIPFAALGADAVITRLKTFLSAAKAVRAGEFHGKQGRGSRAGLLLAGCVIAIAAAAASQLPSSSAAIRSARANYLESPDSPLVSSDELALIQRLPGIVPENSTIAVNPWTGGALAYALADRDTTAKHVLTANSPAVDVLNAQLRLADKVPAVCDAARATHVHYVLDFGTKEVHGGSHRFPGLEDLEHSTAVRLVVQQGEARLYELTACGGN